MISSFQKNISSIILCVAILAGGGVAYAQQETPELIAQKNFLTSAVNAFLQRASQMQSVIQKRTDIFPKEIQGDLLAGVSQDITAFLGYLNDIDRAQSSDELRTLAGTIYEYRMTEDALVRQNILSAYISYFEKVAQQRIVSRHENIQEKIISAKNQGKDTTITEKTFAYATISLKKLQETIVALHTILQQKSVIKGDITTSLSAMEKGLGEIEKQVNDIYAIFRRIAIQGNMMPELDTEERGIQNMFPTESLK